MTPKEKSTKEDKKLQTLDEICENTRAIRRVTNRILDHLHEYQTGTSSTYNDPDEVTWDDMNDYDDMYLLSSRRPILYSCSCNSGLVITFRDEKATKQ